MFAGAIAAAATGSPMTQGAPIPGRVLAIDGDGLAYYCAGNDETSPSDARVRMMEKIADAKRAAGAESVLILLTGQSSHKGHRYAIARAKPYQGHRDNGRRPRNWAHLRSLMESGVLGATTETAYEAEADDLFGKFSTQIGADSFAIHSGDKDMRMVPGLHVDWHSMRTTVVRPGDWEIKWDDVTYGDKWFWLQMLHGDTADFIPGVPKCIIDGKVRLCGPKTAAAILESSDDACSAYEIVSEQYAAYYKDAWPAAMLEQAILLWMRRDVRSSPFDCLNEEYGPMRFMPKPEQAAALQVMKLRIAEAMCVS